MAADGYNVRTLASIGRDAYLDTPIDGVRLEELPWVVSRLNVDALERLVTFFHDMSERPPLSGPAWYAHRELVEAIVSDLRREIERRG